MAVKAVAAREGRVGSSGLGVAERLGDTLIRLPRPSHPDPQRGLEVGADRWVEELLPRKAGPHIRVRVEQVEPLGRAVERGVVHVDAADGVFARPASLNFEELPLAPERVGRWNCSEVATSKNANGRGGGGRGRRRHLSIDARLA